LNRRARPRPSGGKNKRRGRKSSLRLRMPRLTIWERNLLSKWKRTRRPWISKLKNLKSNRRKIMRRIKRE